MSTTPFNEIKAQFGQQFYYIEILKKNFATVHYS